MGWSSAYLPKGTSKLDALRHIEGSSFTDSIVQSHCVGTEVYLACRTRDGQVIGCVCLIERRARQTSIKVMGEESHPFYYNASRKVLDALTPTDSQSAQEWRTHCRSVLALKTAAIGAEIQLTEDVAFVGGLALARGTKGVLLKRSGKNAVVYFGAHTVRLPFSSLVLA